MRNPFRQAALVFDHLPARKYTSYIASKFPTFHLSHCNSSRHCASPFPLCSLKRGLWIAASSSFYHLFIGLANSIPSASPQVPCAPAPCSDCSSLLDYSWCRSIYLNSGAPDWTQCSDVISQVPSRREGCPGTAHCTLANAAHGGSPWIQGLADNHVQLVEYKGVQAFLFRTTFQPVCPSLFWCMGGILPIPSLVQNLTFASAGFHGVPVCSSL